MSSLTLSCVTNQCPKLTQELYVSIYHIAVYVCVCIFPLFVVSSSPITTQSRISNTRSSQDGAMPMTRCHQHSLSGFWLHLQSDHSSPLSLEYRYRCHHGKYLLLLIATQPGIQILLPSRQISVTPHRCTSWSQYRCHSWQILRIHFSLPSQCCDGSFTIAHYLAVHHSTSTPSRRKCDSTGPLLGWPWHK